MEHFDAIVIGGGMYGCAVALLLAECSPRVLLLERESQLLTRASAKNQARIHNGYHYPRSLMTALRSRVNYQRFRTEYASCIDDTFVQYYAVARQHSYVTARQFVTFCERIGAPLAVASKTVTGLFNQDRIEAVFRTEECAFHAGKLRELLLERLSERRVTVRTHACAHSVHRDEQGLVVRVERQGEEQIITAREVFNCAYAGMNELHSRSQLPHVPLTLELAEVALVEVPDALKNIGITVIDGPFFSLMPFPGTPHHALTHVRYTPGDCPKIAKRGLSPNDQKGTYLTHYHHMIMDAKRYVPALAECRHRESFWETKTLLPAYALDDGRPILLQRNHGIAGYTCIIGGKIDTVYDVLDELKIPVSS